MKRYLIGLVVVTILASCAATVSDDASKRKQLQEYKQQLHELNQKIDALETELADSETREVVKIKVSELENQVFEHFIEVTGKVEAEADVDVSPETAGIIKEVLVKEGQRVAKGQILARLNTDVLERSLDELKVQLDLATTNFERQENLWKQNIGSEMQYLQAKNNKESLEKRMASLNTQIGLAEIKSPISGVVDMVYQKKGHIGGPQMPFAKVINMSNMKIYADVSESYLTKIQKGDSVAIWFPALDREIKAEINQISNTINSNNRTFRVRIDLNNPDQMIKPNLVSVIKLRDYQNPEAIVVPSLLIKDDFNGMYTYIVENQGEENVAKKVYVKAGITDNNMTEVTEGLAPGMKVVSEGFNQVVNGTLVQF